MKQDNLIKKLKQLSPVPIEFVEIMQIPGYCGLYFHAYQFMGNAYIEIHKELNLDQRIATLVHEVFHALCVINKCGCMENPDRTVREIHAVKFALKWLLKYKQKTGLKWEINKLIEQSKGNAIEDYYIKVAKYIMKLKLWQKCLDYVK